MTIIQQDYNHTMVHFYYGSNSTGGSNGDVWHEYTANKFAFGHVTNTHITTDESTFSTSIECSLN